MWKKHNRVDELKQVARINYEQYRQLIDHPDSGQALAEEISGRVLLCKLKFNQAMEELKEIDPLCPVIRIE